jgi:hypothetical protein
MRREARLQKKFNKKKANQKVRRKLRESFVKLINQGLTEEKDLVDLE